MCFGCCRKNYTVVYGDQAYKASPEARKEYEIAEKYADARKTAKAFEHYLKSAQLGLADAQLEVGMHYVNKEHDHEQGREWLQKAVAQNDVVAQKYLECLNTLSPGEAFPTSMRHGNVVMFSRDFPQ